MLRRVLLVVATGLSIATLSASPSLALSEVVVPPAPNGNGTYDSTGSASDNALSGSDQDKGLFDRGSFHFSVSSGNGGYAPFGSRYAPFGPTYGPANSNFGPTQSYGPPPSYRGFPF